MYSPQPEVLLTSVFRIYFVLCILLFLSAMAFGLDLQLLDSRGQVMAGAHVSIVGQAGIWIADEQGRVVIQEDLAGPLTLVVSRSDGVAMKPVDLEASSEKGTVVLHLSGLGGSVTVVSSAVPDLEVAPSVASTLMGRGDLSARAPQSLVETLENIPGAGQAGEGHSAVPSLRGLPQHRTLILLDEGRLVTERRAGASGTFLDPETLDEIEVIRGPASVAWGSDAFGGMIRARSRMPGISPEGPKLRYSIQGADGTPGYGAAADFVRPLAGGGLLIGAQSRDYDDYSSPRGEVFDTRWRAWGARVAWEGVIGTGILRLGWRSDRAIDVGKPNPNSRVKRRYYPQEDSDRFGISWEQPLKGAWDRLALSLAWDRYRLVLNKEKLEDNLRPSSRSQSDIEAEDVEFRMELERNLGPVRLVLGATGLARYGLEALNRSFEAGVDGELYQTGEEISIDGAHSEDYGLFTAVSRDFGALRFMGGLRLDSVGSTNSGGYFGDRRLWDSALSGFAALSFDIGGGMELSGQYSRGFRSPLLSDRFYRGETGRGFITGNPDLDSEKSDQYDLSLRYRASRWQMAGYAYLYRIRDMIERYKENGNYYFRNRATGEIKGIEVEASTLLSDDLSLNFGVWWLRGETLDDQAASSDVPAPGADLVIRCDPNQGLGWMLRGALYLEDDRPGPTEVRVGGYAVMDAALSWTFSDQLQFRLLGRNLLDHAYQGSADEDAVLAPGRSILLSLRGRL